MPRSDWQQNCIHVSPIWTAFKLKEIQGLMVRYFRHRITTSVRSGKMRGLGVTGSMGDVPQRTMISNSLSIYDSWKTKIITLHQRNSLARMASWLCSPRLQGGSLWLLRTPTESVQSIRSNRLRSRYTHRWWHPSGCTSRRIHLTGALNIWGLLEGR